MWKSAPRQRSQLATRLHLDQQRSGRREVRDWMRARAARRHMVRQVQQVVWATAERTARARGRSRGTVISPIRTCRRPIDDARDVGKMQLTLRRKWGRRSDSAPGLDSGDLRRWRAESLCVCGTRWRGGAHCGSGLAMNASAAWRLRGTAVARRCGRRLASRPTSTALLATFSPTAATSTSRWGAG